ncbi:SLATT domain-containing protein [Pseudomonas sp. DP-17]|uniref:SLATT domain-containing protein n=1 Tax=Pseudomonas sp. DP-17 TaxID=1580486 RepID=UPI001EFA3443|nr:SLATT domain-containing protein [Pseudomonas sp. DP-17]MCG8905604.1 SLATT domain-containing protein [Pseudomonas sp. DP-17]
MTDLTHLEAQVRECFGRAIYTHKTHEKMADRCAASLRNWKIFQIAIAALTASSALISAIFGQDWAKMAAAALSFLTLIISGYMKGFDPGGTAQKHRDTASSIWAIRESYLSLITDMKSNAISYEKAAERRDELQQKLASIYENAPQTNSSAYRDAQVGLQENEEYTFSDEELDRFLPKALRKDS